MIREAVILAGGRGTRLRSVVPDLPKPMAPVAGKPFLEILLASLARKNIGRVVLSVGYLAESIISHFGQRFQGIEIDYAREDSPLGTGGALRLALQKCREEAVLVLNGDTFLEFDMPSVSRDWQIHRCPIVIGMYSRDTARYGRLSLDGDRVVGFLEKGNSGPGVINAGSYIFPANFLCQADLPEVFSLEQDFFPQELQRSYFRLFAASGMFIDIGVPDDYFLAQTRLAQYASNGEGSC